MSAAQEESDELVSDPKQPSKAAPPNLTNNTQPDLEIIPRTLVFTIRHVPVEARLRWSKFIAEIWTKCHTNPTDIENWKNLLASPKFILRAASRGGGKQKFQHKKLVNGRIVQWEKVTEGLYGTKLFCPKQPKKQEKHRVITNIKCWS